MTVNNIEDCLEYIAGLKDSSVAFSIESSDVSILTSIARQVCRGIGLTDRQYSLTKEKLSKYRNQFENLGITDSEFFEAVETLRFPLREIDRTKTISLVSGGEFLGSNANQPWIKIKFPFNKKTIHCIENIARDCRKDYFHRRGEHEHYFRMTERIAYEVVTQLSGKNFEISNELLNYYKQVEQIAENPDQYVPGIYNGEIKNLHPRAVDQLESLHGKLSSDTILKYRDSAILFGLDHFDDEDLEPQLQSVSTLSAKIVTRQSVNVLAKPSEHSLDSVAQSMHELNRFPLVVLVEDDQALTQLHNSWSSFGKFVSNDQCSVLFRMDNKNKKSAEFNSYVKENQLNSPVDKDTKIVYINRNKLPKPLLKQNWQPRTVLMLNSLRTKSIIAEWIGESDLVLHYDEQASVWRTGLRTKEITTL